MKSGAYTLGFEEIERTHLALVGGKGLNLGILSRVEGVRVPAGYCVTTLAYQKIAALASKLNERIKELSSLKADDTARIARVAADIRHAIENAPVPPEIEEEIRARYAALGEGVSVAVRSSATAEDLPGASFAGQQETFLNIKDPDELLLKVRACWASLFTDRAVSYRMRNGFDHRKVALAVVVQQMVFPDVSGILFTADPVSGNRRVVSIDAGFGLGEALVSGTATADNYRVRDGRVTDRAISRKEIAAQPRDGGGTENVPLPSELQNRPCLSDDQALELAALGRRIERFFLASNERDKPQAPLDASETIETPQDIEWCLAEGTFYILQSRPITTLFPLPRTDDDKLHLYVSMGHVQMMTEEILPLGISFFELLVRDYGRLDFAGGRLFLDISKDLKGFWGRAFLMRSFGQADAVLKGILERLVKDEAFVKNLSDEGSWVAKFRSEILFWCVRAARLYLKDDWSVVERCLARNRSHLEEREHRFENVSGIELFDLLQEDMERMLVEMTHPDDMGLLMLWVASYNWIRNRTEKWLGRPGAIDSLSKSVPHNPTSEMGMELWDISLLVGRYPDVLRFLREARSQKTDLLRDLAAREGGPEARAVLEAFLARWGMRCSGEIDITKPRWLEHPEALIPMILSNVATQNATPGHERFERGRREAEEMAREIAALLEKLSGGKRKARKAQKWIRVWRNVSGFREVPKYCMIASFWTYKKALLREAQRLVAGGVLREKEDAFYLSLDELRGAAISNSPDPELARRIASRKERYVHYAKLSPPRVVTSEGEILRAEAGALGDAFPAGALVGTPVSSGVVEGRARVVLSQQDATVEAGDILVTRFTDPSWTPLFLSVKGLVTEVGGQMTHGAVITREYGLPAVVGVDGATTLIRDGERIRVDGTRGFVERLGG